MYLFTASLAKSWSVQGNFLLECRSKRRGFQYLLGFICEFDIEHDKGVETIFLGDTNGNISAKTRSAIEVQQMLVSFINIRKRRDSLFMRVNHKHFTRTLSTFLLLQNIMLRFYFDSLTVVNLFVSAYKQ